MRGHTGSPHEPCSARSGRCGLRTRWHPRTIPHRGTASELRLTEDVHGHGRSKPAVPLFQCSQLKPPRALRLRSAKSANLHLAQQSPTRRWR